VKSKQNGLWLALLAVLLTVGGCSGASDVSGPVRWRAQAGTLSNSWLYQDFFTSFARIVREKSQGRLEIEVFPPGTIVDAYEQFSAVQRGAVEVGMGVGGYNLKQVPEAYIEQGLFGVFTSVEEFIQFYLEYEDAAVYWILDEAYRARGCHLLPALGPSPLVVISRTPIRSVQELEGKKIRGSGAAPDLITRLGGVPVTLSPTEIFTALQTGTIDGVILPAYTIGTMNLWDVAKGVTGPSFGFLAGDIYVNLEAYEGLPPDLQEIVDQSAEEAMRGYVDALAPRMKGVLEEAQESHGVQIVELTQGEFQAIVEAGQAVREQAASRSLKSRQIIELMKAYLEESVSDAEDPVGPIQSFQGTDAEL